MGFRVPADLEDYLNLDWRKPPESYFNFSNYYAHLSPHYMEYMRRVIRPCLAYASGSADGRINSGVKMNVGYAIKKTATRIIKGEKILFEGDDADCAILSDYWSQSVQFDRFVTQAIDYALDGLCVIKLNKDARGRCIPTAVRVDRAYITTDDTGEIVRATMFNTLLSAQKEGMSYWLVEERYYNKRHDPCVRYRVHSKSSVLTNPITPDITSDGIYYKDLPADAKMILDARRIFVNREVVLPFRDGLGLWCLTTDATNSTVPGLPMSDPILYGALDLLYATDTILAGSLTDIVNGRGKVLVPKKYLASIRQDFEKLGVKTSVADRISDNSRWTDGEDGNFVYVMTEHDQNFIPQSVQFDIRSEKYKGMLEMYLQQIVAICGFAPSSIFPFLADNSAKTATQVTAEDNLTRATVQSVHQAMIPIFNRVLNEVLFQFYSDTHTEWDGSVRMSLSDYVGNPILRDQNLRDNLQAGIIPREIAVQRANGLTERDKAEYIGKIDADEKRRTQYGFNEADYFGDGGLNGNADTSLG